MAEQAQSTDGQHREQVDYLKKTETPQILDAAVAKVLAERPDTRQTVVRTLITQLMSQLSEAERSKIASEHLSNYARSVADADGLAEYSSIAHHLSIGNQQFFKRAKGKKNSSPKTPQGDNSGKNGEGEQSTNSLDEQAGDDEVSSPILRSHSIAAYNMASAIAAEKPLWERSIKCIVTLGPSCNDERMINEIVRCGANMIRINLSHGVIDDHKEALKFVRQVCEATDRQVPIAIDTRGAEVRLGSVPKGKLSLHKGAMLVLSTDPKYTKEPTEDTIFVNWAEIAKNVREGQRIIADGGLHLTVDEVNKEQTEVICRVDNAYELGNNKNVNLPGVTIDIPILNALNLEDFAFALENNIDILFLSFTQSAEDVQAVRGYFRERGKEVTIVAKIENQAGLEALDDILAEADGLMVARGDLGAELPIQKIAAVQKSLIARCNVAGKPVVVSAQLLDSMCANRYPTKAEACDVSNAVLDGVDALMLSAETAIGRYPLESLTTLADLALEAERMLPRKQLFQSMIALQPRPFPTEESIASSAVNTAMELGCKAIITLTTSGSSARLISKYFPPCPIVAVAKKWSTYNVLHMVRGVFPFHYPAAEEDDRIARLDKACNFVKAIGLAKPGDFVILVHAELFGPITNKANIFRVFQLS